MAGIRDLHTPGWDPRPSRGDGPTCRSGFSPNITIAQRTTRPCRRFCHRPRSCSCAGHGRGADWRRSRPELIRCRLARDHSLVGDAQARATRRAPKRIARMGSDPPHPIASVPAQQHRPSRTSASARRNGRVCGHDRKNSGNRKSEILKLTSNPSRARAPGVLRPPRKDPKAFDATYSPSLSGFELGIMQAQSAHRRSSKLG